jgi:hypothetical protein
VNDDAQRNPQHRPSDSEKNGLESMEADESAPVVRFDHKKDDRGNDREISQHARNVVR